MPKKIFKTLIGPFLILLTAVLIVVNDILFTSSSQDNFIYVFISLIVFFSSIVILCIAVYCYYLKQKYLILLAYGAFSFLSSIWSLAQLQFVSDLFFDWPFIFYIKNHTVFLLPLLITVMGYSINNHPKLKIVYKVFTGVFILLEISNIVFQIININVLAVLYDVVFVCIIIYIIILTVMLNKMKVEESKKIEYFTKGAILFTIGFTLEIVNRYVSVLGPKGMYVMVCVMAMFICGIGIIVRDFVKKENYRTYLSEENARLSSSILLSQIKPHFLYNALNSISFLCKKDPKQADMAVIRFSRYLRQNMKCIESSELVDFASETEHIKNYLYLEMIRFPKMEIIYELKFINFKVPPLCIQPIVENAVKHGVSKNTEGGYVVIKSYATQKDIIVEISDNGPGFDTKTDMKGTGLSNISRRLKMLMNAEIEFGSVIGTGTVVRVKIPREGVK